MAFNRREHLLLLAAIVCIAILAGDRFVLTPLASAWSERNARIAELKGNLSKGALLLDRGDSLERRWREMKERSLPREMSATESRVFTAVSEWASDSRLDITSIKPRWFEEEEESRTVEFRVGASGSLDSVARFLYALETDSMSLRTEKVEISSRDPRGNALAVDIRFTGSVILEKE
ncbi:hypothetical protein JW916_02325 [Candidatus Sumerlaeota bacterium]|nr:hypothetical protein [Candidatus Sumerlaeota bacterium]